MKKLLIIIIGLLIATKVYAASYPASYTWRVYRDAPGVDPASPYAAENSAATLDTNSDIVRIRVAVTTVTFGSVNVYHLADFKIQYSTSSSPNATFTDMGSGNAWKWVNEGVNGNTVGTLLLTTTNLAGEYIEVSTDSPTHSKGNIDEWDFAIKPTSSVLASTLYYFRFYITTGALQLFPDASYPRIMTTSLTGSGKILKVEGVADNSIGKVSGVTRTSIGKISGVQGP